MTTELVHFPSAEEGLTWCGLALRVPCETPISDGAQRSANGLLFATNMPVVTCPRCVTGPMVRPEDALRAEEIENRLVVAIGHVQQAHRLVVEAGDVEQAQRLTVAHAGLERALVAAQRERLGLPAESLAEKAERIGPLPFSILAMRKPEER